MGKLKYYNMVQYTKKYYYNNKFNDIIIIRIRYNTINYIQVGKCYIILPKHKYQLFYTNTVV